MPHVEFVALLVVNKLLAVFPNAINERSAGALCFSNTAISLYCLQSHLIEHQNI